MKPLRVIWLALVLVGLPADVCAADVDGALIDKVGGLLEPRGTLDRLAKAVGQEPEEKRDLGFGNAWARFELYGEALTLRIDVVSHRERLAGVLVTSLGGERALLRRIQTAWGKRAKIGPRGVEVRTENATQMKRVVRAAWQGVTAETRTGPPWQEREISGTIADPLTELTFGWACYEDGAPPEGRPTADRFWREGSSWWIDRALTGPNPEGRVYAAEVILRWKLEGQSLGESCSTRARRVLALDVPIRSCAGCLVSAEKAADLVSEKIVRESALCRVRVEASVRGTTWIERRILVYQDGRMMAERLAAPLALACIPMIARESIPEATLSALRTAVKAGKGFVVDDGIPTFDVKQDALADAPKAIRDLLAALPKHVR